jgi:hypothetical protein
MEDGTEEGRTSHGTESQFRHSTDWSSPGPGWPFRDTRNHREARYVSCTHHVKLVNEAKAMETYAPSSRLDSDDTLSTSLRSLPTDVLPLKTCEYCVRRAMEHGSHPLTEVVLEGGMGVEELSIDDATVGMARGLATGGHWGFSR